MHNAVLIQNEHLGEHYYKLSHPSGLTVVVYPKRLDTVYAIFATKYGSLESSFATDEEPLLTVPDGIAHFLEHKLFEEENGGDVFERFASLGVSANAFTSRTMTAYVFSATSRYKEALNELLDFVMHPYFTEENVEKEQGIIAQEINMYLDDPGNQLYYNLLECLFSKHNIRTSILGTVDSISKITPALLYKCYYTFYRLSNMTLVVCGNVDKEAVFSAVDKAFADVRSDDRAVRREYPEEPKLDIVSPYRECRMAVSKPMFAFGVKDMATHADEKERMRHAIIGELLLRCCFSDSTDFYDHLYQEGLLDKSLGYEHATYASCAYQAIYGESDDPKTVFERCSDLLKNISENMPTESDFSRTKRAMYAEHIRTFDNTESSGYEVTDALHSGLDFLKYGDMLASVTYEELVAFAENFYCDKQFALSVIYPLSK